jgi:F-type H+-transporting ATPase subunit b
MPRLTASATEAQGEAARILAGAERDIGRRAGALAVDICTRVLERAPGLAAPEGWLPGLAEGIAALPEASRKRIADGPVKLTFGHMPDAAGQAACRKALETAFGAPLDLTLAEDTGLLAGLEFSAPEIVLRNHLRADLDRMATTLAADD